MTIYEFRQGYKYNQAMAVFAGKHIADRLDREHIISLYLVEDYYVEVFFHRDYHVVSKFRSFSNIEQLNPYLDQLNLNAFL